ncbi:MAG: hypothetical protein AB1792_08295 [Candidatus Zixiibacteriota bacterium]
MKSRTTLAIPVLAVLACATPSPTAECPSFWQVDSLRAQVMSGIDATANDHFAMAESIFTDLAHRVPQSPVGPLFIAAAIQAEMLDAESADRTGDFRAWLVETQNRARRLIDRAENTSEVEFALGAADGYDAIYESHWGGWFATLKKAMRAHGHFQAALDADTGFVDAYLGIGNYNYWKSVGTDFINWLPFIPDRRALGLEQIRLAACRGTFARTAARASLAAALIHEDRFEEALAQADTLRQECPDGKASLWLAAQANFRLYRWMEARGRYEDIARRILRDGPGNYFNLIECAYYAARCRFEEGQWPETLAECHRALAFPAPEDVRQRQKGKLKELRRLQERVKRMVAASPASGADSRTNAPPAK